MSQILQPSGCSHRISGTKTSHEVLESPQGQTEKEKGWFVLSPVRGAVIIWSRSRAAAELRDTSAHPAGADGALYSCLSRRDGGDGRKRREGRATAARSPHVVVRPLVADLRYEQLRPFLKA